MAQKSNKKLLRSARNAPFSKGVKHHHRSNPSELQKQKKAAALELVEWQKACEQSFEDLSLIEGEINAALEFKTSFTPKGKVQGFMTDEWIDEGLPYAIARKHGKDGKKRFLRLHKLTAKNSDRVIGVKIFCVVDKNAYTRPVFTENANNLLAEGPRFALEGYKAIQEKRDDALDALDGLWQDVLEARDQGIVVDIVATSKGFAVKKGEIRKTSNLRRLEAIRAELGD